MLSGTPMLDALEPRTHFAFAAAVDFQPPGVPTPAGYVADTGLTYAARNGLTYGWSKDNKADARDRNSPESPDQRHDTFAYFRKNAAKTWDLAVPNGTYAVRLVVGDANVSISRAVLNVEGKTAVDAPITQAKRWTDTTFTTIVADGKLTFAAAAGYDATLCFVEVQQKVPAPGVDYDAGLMDQIDGVFTVAQASATRTMADLGHNANKSPLMTKADGTWETTDHTKWTSGFWPGVMWQIYSRTKGNTWLTNAKKWTAPLASQTQKQGDLAFRFMTSTFHQYQKTKSAADRDVLLKAAAAKNAMWNDKVGAFQTTWYYSHSGNPKANFAVLMDMTTDLELMMWAGKEANKPQYVDRAKKHFERVSQYLVAPDGGTRHFALFDKATGQFQGNETYQGYADSSTWGRGQAWAVMSFANMARDTGSATTLAAARKVADFYIANAPADGVAYWDFDDPAVPNTHRDSSAAAIAADGMLTLAKQIADPAQSAVYRRHAETILKSLIADYLIVDPKSPQRGLLKHGALDVPNRPAGNDVSLIFGDYYFLAALNRYATFA